MLTRRALLRLLCASFLGFHIGPAHAEPPDDVARFRDQGSAGRLTGVQKLLFLFVTDPGAPTWTSRLCSPIEWKIESALRWLETEAASFGQDLHMAHVCAPSDGDGFKVAVRIQESDVSSGPHHASWQNEVAMQMTGGTGSVASLWDAMFTRCNLPLSPSDGSAIFFVVRRYVPSIAFQYAADDEPEFSKERGIIYDEGGAGMQRYLDSEIAHEILHLYGAVDLAPGKTPASLVPFRAFLDPDDVMGVPTQRPLTAYHISDLTAYLVGWRDARPKWWR